MRWLRQRSAKRRRYHHSGVDADSEDSDDDLGGSSSGLLEWLFTELIARHEVKALNAVLILYLVMGTMLFHAMSSNRIHPFAFFTSGRSNNSDPTSRGSSMGTSDAMMRDAEKSLQELRMESVRKMWNITNRLNILYESNWSSLVLEELIEFERRLVDSMASRYRFSGGCGDATDASDDEEDEDGRMGGIDEIDKEHKKIGISNKNPTVSKSQQQQQQQRNALADRIRSMRQAFSHSLATITTIGKWSSH